jgi:hypothetical protein
MRIPTTATTAKMTPGRMPLRELSGFALSMMSIQFNTGKVADPAV